MRTNSLINLKSIVTLTVGITASISVNASPSFARVLPTSSLIVNPSNEASTGSLFWSFDFTLDSGERGVGVFETENEVSPASEIPPGNGYFITSLTGNLSGLTMTLLPFRNDGISDTNNNILYPFGPPTFTNLDSLGFSFNAGTTNYNIFSDDQTFYYEQNTVGGNDVFQLQNWTPVTATSSAVPEPSIMLGVLPALGLANLLKRKLNKKNR